jgi:hypothetical protein
MRERPGIIDRRFMTGFLATLALMAFGVWVVG